MRIKILMLVSLLAATSALPKKPRRNSSQVSGQRLLDIAGEPRIIEEQDDPSLEFQPERNSSSQARPQHQPDIAGEPRINEEQVDPRLEFQPERNSSSQARTQRQPGVPRIVQEPDVPLKEFPYHVGLSTEKNGLWANGALISDRWVVTTATVATIYLPEKNAIALLGARDPNSRESNQQRIKIDKIIIHESYEEPFANNIALLRLKTSAKLNNFVKPAKWASSDDSDYRDSLLRMTSFSYTLDPTNTQYIRYIELYGIANTACEKVWNINAGNLCADTGRLAGAFWDHGGPLVDGEFENGYLVGLLMFCGTICYIPRRPDVFVRLSHYDKWIKDKVY